MIGSVLAFNRLGLWSRFQIDSFLHVVYSRKFVSLSLVVFCLFTWFFEKLNFYALSYIKSKKKTSHGTNADFRQPSNCLRDLIFTCSYRDSICFYKKDETRALRSSEVQANQRIDNGSTLMQIWKSPYMFKFI